MVWFCLYVLCFLGITFAFCYLDLALFRIGSLGTTCQGLRGVGRRGQVGRGYESDAEESGA